MFEDEYDNSTQQKQQHLFSSASFHQFTDEQQSAWIKGGAIEALRFVDGVFVLGKDGSLVGLIGVDLKLDAVNRVWQVRADQECRQSMIDAVGIKARNDSRWLIIESEGDLTAIGANDVVNGAAGAFELKGNGFSSLAALVQSGHAPGPALAEFIGHGIQSPETCRECGFLDRHKFGHFIMIGHKGSTEDMIRRTFRDAGDRSP